VQDVARDEGLTIDMDSYKKSMSSQKNQSRNHGRGAGKRRYRRFTRSLPQAAAGLFLSVIRYSHINQRYLPSLLIAGRHLWQRRMMLWK
jgi:hypothetical protein